MRAARHVVWPVGLVLLALTVPVIRAHPAAYSGAGWSWPLWLATGAALALIMAGTLVATTVSGAALQILGVLWLAPGLAYWISGPDPLRTVADATGRLLPALAVVAALQVGARPSRWRAAATVAALAAGVWTAAVRLLAVDPFLDPRCVRACGHNPLLLLGLGDTGLVLEHAGAGLTALAAVGACAILVAPSRGGLPPWGTAAAVALVLGLAAPGVLRWTVGESTASPPHLLSALAAQLGAIGLAAALTVGHLRQWWLSVRLSDVASGLRAAPAAGTLAAALGRAVGDADLRVLYWAPERGAYVDADGVPVADPAPTRSRRVTAVARHGQRLAALVHSADIDGQHLDRALRPALRLVLENERLRAATLAELHEAQVSRVRIVQRAADERRRLERNLHDGAQQRVVSLSVLLRLLRDRLPDGAAADLAARAQALTRTTLEELRRVARGIYPAVLADAGLAGAVFDLAESSADLVVRVDQVPGSRYKGTVETTAYLVVAAALADARTRHAATLSISAAERDGVLAIDVRDDAPDPAGAFPADLVDQVRAIGGRVLVTPAHPGAHIRLEVPCAS